MKSLIKTKWNNDIPSLGVLNWGIPYFRAGEYVSHETEKVELIIFRSNTKLQLIIYTIYIVNDVDATKSSS